eukprot:3670163-Prymnesium_polylepis.1
MKGGETSVIAISVKPILVPTKSAWPWSCRRVLVMSIGKVAPSAAIDDTPVRQNFFRMPMKPEPVSAPPPICADAAGMTVVRVLRSNAAHVRVGEACACVLECGLRACASGRGRRRRCSLAMLKAHREKVGGGFLRLHASQPHSLFMLTYVKDDVESSREAFDRRWCSSGDEVSLAVDRGTA